MLRCSSNYCMSINMEPNISTIASMIGEPARAKILIALMGGKALTATELAIEAETSSSTASSHLSKLTEHRLLKVRKQGRHKYFQLYDQDIAVLIESLMNLSLKHTIPRVFTGPRDSSLRYARVCYDHLAGSVAVSLFDTLIQLKHMAFTEGHLHLTESGKLFFQKLGFVANNSKVSKRPVCKACLDWSERRDHVAGILGQWILNDILDKRWAIREDDSRVITFTKTGIKKFKQQYNIY